MEDLIERLRRAAKESFFLKDLLSEAADALQDIQPVKHGRWRENELYGLKIYNCSYCNAPQWWNTDKYCHECGTKMDGDKNG